LYFKRNGNIYPINYSVKEFSIEDSEDSSKEKTYHFQNGFPKISRNDSTTFYEVLFAGDALQLLRWEHKTIREIYNYNAAYESQYTPVQEFFVFYPKENKMVSLGYKVNATLLRKKLPSYSEQIETYSSLHEVNIKQEDSLIQLFVFLDSAKQ
jgi:hypothetical protein